MIKRIVKMVFRSSETENFIQLFQERKEQIRGFEGCTHLELFRSTREPDIFFTYSYWESEDALNVYRHSSLFEDTWAKTKVLFSEKPQAWSVEVIAEL